MIGLLLGVVPTLFRVDVPPGNEMSFCAAAPLPKLGYQDLELFEVGLRALRKGSGVFSPGTIRQVTEGRGIDCRLLGDSAMVSFTVNKATLQSGVDLLASLMMSPALEEDDLKSALSSFSKEKQDFWSVGMNPVRFDLKEAPRADVLSVFRRVFDPSRVVIAFGGAATADQVGKLWSFQTQDWSPAPPPHLPDDSVPIAVETVPGDVTITELVGKVRPSADPAILLALFELGFGKGSSLFRISRDKHGWSYRQEAYLRPAMGGWIPLVFVPMASTPEAANRIKALAIDLEADVDGWTENDRQRALGMAEASLLRFSPFSPLVLGDRTLGSSEEDRVSMGAYWRMKTGAEWDPQALYEQMSRVTLEQLKTAGRDMLVGSRALVLNSATSPR